MGAINGSTLTWIKPGEVKSDTVSGTFYPMPKTPHDGWRCPSCGRNHAPWVAHCPCVPAAPLPTAPWPRPSGPPVIYTNPGVPTTSPMWGDDITPHDVVSGYSSVGGTPLPGEAVITT